MYCKNCGNKLDKDAVFCTKCGKRIDIIEKAHTENPVEKEIDVPTISKKMILPPKEVNISSDTVTVLKYFRETIKIFKNSKIRIIGIISAVITVSAIIFFSNGRLLKKNQSDVKISEKNKSGLFYSQNKALIVEKINDEYFIEGVKGTAIYGEFYYKRPISEFEAACILDKAPEVKNYLKSASYDEKIHACRLAIAGSSFQCLKIILNTFTQYEMDNFIDVGYYYRDKSESPDRKHARLLGHSELLEEFYYDERPPLIWAAALNLPEIVKLLIENGCNINARTDMNANALMFAAAYNSCDAIKILIKEGINTTAKGICGISPLMFAASENACDAANLLIDNYEDTFHYTKSIINEKDDNDTTPLKYAAYENAYNMAKLLIENNADVNIKDSNDVTPLMNAAFRNNYDMAELFIQNGADVNAKDNIGVTSIMYAAFIDASNIASLLIQNGADINVKDDNGRTPLMYGVLFSAYDVAELLIKNGADVNVMDNDGKSVLENAPNEKMRALLKKYGAKY